MNKKFIAILLTLAMTSPLIATTSTAGYISKSKAKEIVLAHSGVSSKDATFVKTELDTENGKHEIDVEFFVPFSFNGISVYKEYDYDLNAFNGTILSLDWDIEEFNNNVVDQDWDGIDDKYDSQNNNFAGNVKYLSKSEATNIVLNHAKVKSSDAVFVKTELDHDDGVAELEIEFFVKTVLNNQTVYKEYDYELDAITGRIISSDLDIENFNDYDDDDRWDDDNNFAGNVKYLSESEAQNIVLNHAKVRASDATFTKTELDYDDGVAEFEIDFFVKSILNNQTVHKEYDYELDAITGRIISSDLEIENFYGSNNNQWDDDWDDRWDNDDDDDWDDRWDDDDDDDWDDWDDDDGDDWDDQWDEDDDDDWDDRWDDRWDDDDDDDWDDRWDDDDDDDWDDRWDDDWDDRWDD